MCRMCKGDSPSPTSFGEFEKKVKAAIRNVNSLTDFLSKARAIDKLRFNTGDEWGEPDIYQSVKSLIFSNPDPDEGLYLFILGCWLDMQKDYTIVWNTYLKQAKNWINSKGPVPREKYRLTTKHMLLTKSSVTKYGNVGSWFVQKINQIAETNGKRNGNIYRLAGEICSDFYSKPGVAGYLRNGILPKLFSGGDHKRFWMFLMFLRRDNSVVRCLFDRALNKFAGGQKAAQYWYDEEYFNPIECELPVDTWVLTNWNKIFDKIGLASYKTESTAQVATKARELAIKNNMSPSAFDAICFYS